LLQIGGAIVNATAQNSPEIAFGQIAVEFDESLGYIKNDIEALCHQNERVNYTVALLVGVGCEFLAEGDGNKRPYEVFAELLPSEDWRTLAKPLFEAVRNGLAHKFDTKHLYVDGERIQIYFSWDSKEIVVVDAGRLFIGTRPLGLLFCTKIEEFRRKLQTDAMARRRFKQIHSSEDFTNCSAPQAAAWKRLLAGK
jgi:hypothetical protein